LQAVSFSSYSESHEENKARQEFSKATIAVDPIKIIIVEWSNSQHSLN
jgi:hypothetical protein